MDPRSLTPARLAAVGGLFVAVVVLTVLVLRAGDDGHTVYVTTPSATNVIVGQEVRSAGQAVGSVDSLEAVRGGRAARIGLTIDDEAWPLPKGSTMALRWGGTISYSNRYVALTRASGGPAIPDGGSLPASDFTSPVEVDEVLGTFTKPTRAGLNALVDNGGPALRTSGPALRRAIERAPAAVEQADLVLRDAEIELDSLRTLVSSTDSVVDAVNTANPGLGPLVSGATLTFNTLAANTQRLQATLDRAPGLMAKTRATLGRADHTLAAAADLTDRVAPGVAELRRIARPLNSVLATVETVGPDARATLGTAAAAAPDLDRLLRRATRLMPQVGSIGRQSTEQLKCIRPYTADVIAFFSNWGDFLSYTDGRDKFIRANVQSFLPAPLNIATYNSAEAKKAWPGMRFGFPRPPGTNVGKPVFLPACGAGRDALDPAFDAESRSFNPLGKFPTSAPKAAR